MNSDDKKKKAIVEALGAVGVKDFIVLGFYEETRPSEDLRGFWAITTRDTQMFIANLAKIFEGNQALAHLLGLILEANELSRRLAEVEARTAKQEGKA